MNRSISIVVRALLRVVVRTLRGLASRAPYFHDGSAATLEDVVEHYVRLRGLVLTARQKADLVAYLKTL